MEKIVILSGNSERNESLVECLNALFPDCEIKVQYNKTEDFEDASIHMNESLKVRIR